MALRKRNYSVYEISQALKEQGTPLSATAVREVLPQRGSRPCRAGSTTSRPGPERFGIGWRHLLDLMTECNELTRYVMRSHAGFDADEAWRNVRKSCGDPG